MFILEMMQEAWLSSVCCDANSRHYLVQPLAIPGLMYIITAAGTVCTKLFNTISTITRLGPLIGPLACPRCRIQSLIYYSPLLPNKYQSGHRTDLCIRTIPCDATNQKTRTLLVDQHCWETGQSRLQFSSAALSRWAIAKIWGNPFV